MTTIKNDEAVSPVIGVILMVAITVILAAVIAAFVFGMAGGIQKTKIVAASAQQIGVGTDSIHITYQGGQNHADVENLTAMINGVKTTKTFAEPPVVGSEVTGEGTVGQDHVVVTAAYSDGTTSVILDTYV